MATNHPAASRQGRITSRLELLEDAEVSAVPSAGTCAADTGGAGSADAYTRGRQMPISVSKRPCDLSSSSRTIRARDVAAPLQVAPAGTRVAQPTTGASIRSVPTRYISRELRGGFSLVVPGTTKCTSSQGTNAVPPWAQARDSRKTDSPRSLSSTRCGAR